MVIEKPCDSVDILPTLSNLFGVDYDSRLLMGHDVFSTASPLVVFSNHSWLTDQGRYNAVTGKFTANDGVSVNKDYVQNMMNKVNAMFTYSAKILDNIIIPMWCLMRRRPREMWIDTMKCMGDPERLPFGKRSVAYFLK